MGLLTSALRVAHPVRTVKRGVKRAVIPRPVRKTMRAGRMVANPLGSVEGAVKYSFIGAVDGAVTPGRPKRSASRRRAHVQRAKRQAQKRAQNRANMSNPWFWVAFSWIFSFLITIVLGAWPFFIGAILFTALVVLYKIGVRQHRLEAARADQAQPSRPINTVRPPTDD